MASATPATPRSGGEILSLTALRAIAAWWVVVYHVHDLIELPGPLMHVLKQGWLAVDVFFVMSGYVLARQYLHLFQHRISRRRYAWFLWVRLARIYPLHIVILLLFLSIPFALWITGRPPADTYRWPEFLRSVVLIQDWGFPGALIWNVPAWSISAEFAFYIAYPLVAWVVVRLWRTRAGLVWSMVALIGLIWARGVTSALVGGGIVGSGVFRCMTECLLGMGLYRASQFWSPGPRAALRSIAAGLVLLAIHGSGRVPEYLALAPSCLCLVWGLLEPTNAISRALSHPLLLWLGRVSFSTYLCHFLIRNWLVLVVVGRVSPGLMLLVYVVLVVCASSLLHDRLEVPARQAGRRLGDRWFGAAGARGGVAARLGTMEEERS